MNALFLICGLGVFSLVAEIVNFKRGLIMVMMAGLLTAGILVIIDFGTSTLHFSDMLMFNDFSLAFSGLIIGVSIFWLWMSYDYFQLQPHLTDRAALILFTIAGAVIMASFNNMAMLFLGIEILSISLYVLAGSRKESLNSTEAAFKYFLMGSFATGFLLMGIALVYGATGSFDITKIAAFVAAHETGLPAFFYAGVLLMLVGLTFKISAVPFHFWAPDVYEGSPTVITAFMSTVVKIAAIAAFYRIFALCFSSVQATWITALQVITVLTLIVANLTAVFQSGIKRMLAYSSVGHVGYILLGFIATDTGSTGAVFYYLNAYAIASLTAFTVVHELERDTPAIAIQRFNGLFKKSPFMAVAMTLALLSLAGIPPLPGFFGKYMVFALAIENGYTGLVIVAIATSLIGVYYYFRVIIAMFFSDSAGENTPLTWSVKLLIAALTIISIFLTVFADRVLNLVG